MEVKNKTVAIQVQEAFEDGIAQGIKAHREATSGRLEWDAGLAIAKANNELREFLYQRIMDRCQCGEDGPGCQYETAAKIVKGELWQ